MAQLVSKDENKTHMVAGENQPKEAAAKVETVKIKVLRDVSIGGIVRKPGDVLDVAPDVARELCTPIAGHHAFRGERYADDQGDVKRFDLTRAKLVKED